MQKGWKAELQEIIDKNNHFHLRKSKVISNETRDDRAELLFLCFRQLREAGYKLDDPRGLGLRHVKVLVEQWEKDGLSVSTLQKRLSVLRGFAGWIGKGDMIPVTKQLVSDPANATRHYAATRDKSWSANGIATPELVALVTQRDKWVGVQLEIMDAFGCRPKEAISMRPRLADDGTTLHITRGTKGGLHRIFPIDTPKRREVLDRAKAMVSSGDAFLANPMKRLHQNIRRFYYIADLCGITKEQLGVTAYGLRHQMMNDELEKRLGRPTPVRGGKWDGSDEERKARHEVANLAGHDRISITTAYSGGHTR